MASVYSCACLHQHLHDFKMTQLCSPLQHTMLMLARADNVYALQCLTVTRARTAYRTKTLAFTSIPRCNRHSTVLMSLTSTGLTSRSCEKGSNSGNALSCTGLQGMRSAIKRLPGARSVTSGLLKDCTSVSLLASASESS